jgi:anti-anti-sigma regulatory factor
MSDIFLDRIGDVAVLQPDGRFVQADAVFALRYAVTSLGNARAIVLDLSEVEALEDGGVDMLASLHQWTCDHCIGLKLFNPSNLVQERLDRANWAWLPEVASRGEILAILAAAIGCKQSPSKGGITREHRSFCEHVSEGVDCESAA